jgi:hypothetical protein
MQADASADRPVGQPFSEALSDALHTEPVTLMEELQAA